MADAVLFSRWRTGMEGFADFEPILHEYFGKDRSDSRERPKFLHSPMATIAAVAWIKGRPVGIAGASLQRMADVQRSFVVSFSIVNYVSPEARGLGLFPKLLEELRDLASAEGVRFMLTYPSSDSLPGFVRAGYEPAGHSYQDLSISPSFVSHFLSQSPQLFKQFVPGPSAIPSSGDIDRFVSLLEGNARCTTLLTPEFLRYRLGASRGQRYTIDNSRQFGVIGMHGTRGKVRELRVLATAPRVPSVAVYDEMVSFVHRRYSVDLVSRRRAIGVSRPPAVHRRFVELPGRPPLYARQVGAVDIAGFQREFVLSGIDTHTW